MLSQAVGPSTIANVTVTTDAGNGPSDGPASMRDTILALSPIPTLSQPRRRTRKTQGVTILTSSPLNAIWNVDRKVRERVRGKVKRNTRQRKGWPKPKGPRKLTKAAMKRNGLIWYAENQSVGVGHDKSGLSAKTVKI